MLKVPNCISSNIRRDANIQFAWDEWSSNRPGQRPDKKTEDRLAGISLRGNAAFAIGTAQWIVTRFEQFLDLHAVWNRLEAGWAQMVSFHYSWAWDTMANWTGPIKGPVRVAVARVAAVLAAVRDYGDTRWSAATLADLADGVLTEPNRYRLWRDTMLDRLLKYCPSSGEDRLGDVVPIETIDLDSGFSPDQSGELVDRFLINLNWRLNPFLRAPDVAEKLGVAGTPYRFRSADDQLRRSSL